MYFDPETAKESEMRASRDLNGLHHRIIDILNSYSPTRHHSAKEKIAEEVIQAVIEFDMGVNLDQAFPPIRLHLHQPDESDG